MRIDPSVLPAVRIAPEPADVCPECHGRGWVVVADGGAGTARPCACRKKDVVPRLLDYAEVPERYRRCTLENFSIENPDPDVRKSLWHAKTFSQKYVDDFIGKDGEFCESGLLYVGPPGTGKTHLAAAVLQELIRRYQVRGRFVDFTSLIHKIQATFDPSSLESKHEVLDPVIDADVLVFDELGAQKPTEWVRDTLYLVINTRYTRRRATIFTTNFVLERPSTKLSQPRVRVGTDAEVVEAVKSKPPPPDEILGERLSEALVSRLHQMAKIIRILGPDYRQTIKYVR